MAEQSGGGATPWLAFLVGGLIVVVAIIAFVLYQGGGVAPASPKSVDVNLTLPKAPPMPDAPRLPAAPTPEPK